MTVSRALVPQSSSSPTSPRGSTTHIHTYCLLHTPCDAARRRYRHRHRRRPPASHVETVQEQIATPSLPRPACKLRPCNAICICSPNGSPGRRSTAVAHRDAHAPPHRKFGKHIQKRQLDLPEYASSFVDYKALKKVSPVTRRPGISCTTRHNSHPHSSLRSSARRLSSRP